MESNINAVLFFSPQGSALHQRFLQSTQNSGENNETRVKKGEEEEQKNLSPHLSHTELHPIIQKSSH